MDEVTTEIVGNVAVITLSAPEIRNGITPAMGRQIEELCNAIDADEAIGCAIIRGEGGTFCSGADKRLWPMYADASGDAAYHETSAIYQAFVRVGNLAVPTISAVRGAAVGAGLNLMLATDLRVVATNARIMAGFMRLGVHPGGGFFALTARTAGRETAAALGLFGQEISGDRAGQLGLAWAVVSDADVEDRAMELAEGVARDPLLARYAVASFRTQLGPPSIPWAAALEMDRGVQLWSQERRLGRLKTEAPRG